MVRSLFVGVRWPLALWGKESARLFAALDGCLLNASVCFDHGRGSNVNRCVVSNLLLHGLSQVRAAREGECAEVEKRFFGSAIAKRWCVKSKARDATNNMFPTKGKEAVDKVFDRCYNDLCPTTS